VANNIGSALHPGPMNEAGQFRSANKKNSRICFLFVRFLKGTISPE
jgi:hypothetical protein